MQAAELLTEGVALRRQTRIGFSEHLIFFDSDGDGFITLEETRRGLARLGIGTLREERAGRLLGRVRNFVQRWLL